MVIRPGDVVADRYRVDGIVGEGGMGIVMAAYHLALKERVALKVLKSQATSSAPAVARFLREAQAAARVKSAHVVRVLDAGTLTSGEPYLVMEYLVGQDLREKLLRDGPLPVAAAIDCLLQVCDAVCAAHAENIVHRDLKPSNLFVTKDAAGGELVKVLDFGLAKLLPPPELTDATTEMTLTTAAQLLGSPSYMSPEQIRNAADVDQRTDVWSLGIILHELLAGEPPFQASTVSALLAAISADAPPRLRQRRPDVPARLEALVLACLEKDPLRRTIDVATLARGLRTVGTSGRLRAAGGTRTWLVLSAAALVLVGSVRWLRSTAPVAPPAPAVAVSPPAPPITPISLPPASLPATPGKPPTAIDGNRGRARLSHRTRPAFFASPPMTSPEITVSLPPSPPVVRAPASLESAEESATARRK